MQWEVFSPLRKLWKVNHLIKSFKLPLLLSHVLIAFQSFKFNELSRDETRSSKHAIYWNEITWPTTDWCLSGLQFDLIASTFTNRLIMFSSSASACHKFPKTETSTIKWPRQPSTQQHRDKKLEWGVELRRQKSKWRYNHFENELLRAR